METAAQIIVGMAVRCFVLGASIAVMDHLIMKHIEKKKKA